MNIYQRLTEIENEIKFLRRRHAEMMKMWKEDKLSGENYRWLPTSDPEALESLPKGNFLMCLAGECVYNRNAKCSKLLMISISRNGICENFVRERKE